MNSGEEFNLLLFPLRSQLRRAYDAQCEEIRKLKQTVAVKDRRIRELEDQLQRYKHSYITDSTA